MNTRTWIVTGSLATVVATGGVAAAMAAPICPLSPVTWNKGAAPSTPPEPASAAASR